MQRRKERLRERRARDEGCHGHQTAAVLEDAGHFDQDRPARLLVEHVEEVGRRGDVETAIVIRKRARVGAHQFPASGKSRGTHEHRPGGVDADNACGKRLHLCELSQKSGGAPPEVEQVLVRSRRRELHRSPQGRAARGRAASRTRAPPGSSARRERGASTRECQAPDRMNPLWAGGGLTSSHDADKEVGASVSGAAPRRCRDRGRHGWLGRCPGRARAACALRCSSVASSAAPESRVGAFPRRLWSGPPRLPPTAAPPRSSASDSVESKSTSAPSWHASSG